MRYLLMLFMLLFPLFSYPEGFGGDTQVLTQDGYVAIKTLNAGDSVVCFDPSTSACPEVLEGLSTGPSTAFGPERVQRVERSRTSLFVASTVSGAFKYLEQPIVILSVGQEKIISAKGQRFFSASSMDWIDAEKISAGDKLLSLDGDDILVDSVEVLNESKELYKISVDDYSNYFVTSKNLLVHNFLYNTAIEAASAVTARISMGVCPEVCKRIVALVSNAMPHIETIFVAAFSAFLIKHKITEQEDDTSFGKKYGYAEEFYEESPFAYGASKDVIDRCDIVLDYFLKPTYSLAPILGRFEYEKVCAFSKNEIELQLKEKVLPKLLAAKKEFLKKQEGESKKKDSDSDGDGEGDGDGNDNGNDDDKNKGYRQVKSVDKEEIVDNDNNINHMLQPKHGFDKIGIDTPEKAKPLFESVLDKVFQKGLEGKLEIKENGTFKTTIECQGHKVGFKGMVLEGGEMKYGTVYLPEFYNP